VTRPRHAKGGAYEDLLREAERAGWTVTGGGNKHYKLKCPNSCRCIKTMSTTPSNPNYLRNMRAQLHRVTCWEDR
jgi:hypothetical protein